MLARSTAVTAPRFADPPARWHANGCLTAGTAEPERRNRNRERDRDRDRDRNTFCAAKSHGPAIGLARPCASVLPTQA
jgi:hypothetical protein